MKIAFIKPRGRKLFSNNIFTKFVDGNALVKASGVNIFFCPNLQCINIAATLPEHCTAEYIDEEVDELFDINRNYDLVYLSPVITYQVDRAYEIAKIAREKGVYTVIGGIHPTILPDESQEFVDTVFVGEEEAVWPDFFKDFLENKPKTRYETKELIDMTKIPLPRYDLTPMENYKMIHIQASRGCPMGCDFCEDILLYGTKQRHKTPVQVVREIEYIKTLSDNLPPLFLFSDANMFVDRKYSRELMKKLIPMGIRFSCYSDISIADDEELLELISEAGCYEMVIGLESLDVENLEVISAWKRKKVEKYEELIERIQKHGIGVSGSFIIGYDHDNVSTFDSLEKFINKTKLYEVSISVLTPLPGTPVYYRLKEEGRIISTNWEDYTTWSVVFEPKNMTADELQERLGELYKKIFSKERILERARHFKGIIKRKLMKKSN